MKKNKSNGRPEIILANPETISHMIHVPDSDEPEKIDWEKIGSEIFVLPLRNNTIFPFVVMPVQTARPKSVDLVKKAYKNSLIIAAVSQKNAAIENPSIKDLHTYGTACRVAKIFEMPDGSCTAILQGISRIKIVAEGSSTDFLSAFYQPCTDITPKKNNKEFNAILDAIKDVAIQVVENSNELPDETIFAIRNIESSNFLINFIATNTNLENEYKAELLSIGKLDRRGVRLLELLNDELQKLKLRGDIQNKAKREMDRQQREYFLNQQIKTIQSELGEDPNAEEISELEAKAQDKNWPDYVATTFKKELARLKVMNPQSPDYSTQLNYIQTVLDLPWNDCTTDNYDLKHARKVLDGDHYGLDKIKERILEYLAVLKLKGNLKSPILCLYGPPGVGKTSLGRSIASALGRKYVRVSLGGLYDEAEIRGHRKTYIGAMPGRIIQNIKKAGTSNPVFVLDEIDKISTDFHGDPASALLEVLDPEQNFEFHDNYLDLDYDLSKVMFVATANNISTINPALLDRMELINVSGYVTEEKVEIAHKHLIPKILENHGIKKTQLKFSQEILTNIINNYTRESGVRELTNTLASIVRKAAVKIASNEKISAKVTEKNVEEALGKPKYLHDEYMPTNLPGLVTGLAWTAAGGEILTIETSLSRGTGALTITGNLGNVMKESAEIALQYVKANARQLKIHPAMFKAYNVHLHVPEGAIPKDGPSAGITIFSSFASLYTQRPATDYIAMTGELTLTGRVLPVGGVKEKILAAKRAGIKKIFMSTQNRRDIDEINQMYLSGLEFIYVDTAMELIPLVLKEQRVENPVPIPIAKKDVDKQNK